MHDFEIRHGGFDVCGTRHANSIRVVNGPMAKPQILFEYDKEDLHVMLITEQIDRVDHDIQKLRTMVTDILYIILSSE